MSSNDLKPITIVSVGEWEIFNRADELFDCISSAYLNMKRFHARYGLLEDGQRIGLSMRGEIFRALVSICVQRRRAGGEEASADPDIARERQECLDGECLLLRGDKCPVIIDDTLPKMAVAPGLYRSDIVFVLLDAQEVSDGRVG